MAAPTITELPAAPLRSDDPDVFSSKAEAYVAAQEDLPGEINAFGDYLNSYSPVGVVPSVVNFTSDGEVRIYADTAMTLTEQDTSGTGTVAYEKSTAAAPDTFASTTSPISLEAGAWLKVSASTVSTIFAVALKRTA